MARGALLWRNDADTGVVTVSSAYAKLPGTYLQTPQLTQRWRTNDGAHSAYVICDLLASKPIDLVALMATNLVAASTVRVRISTADPTGVDASAYDSTAAASGLTAGYPHLVRALATPVVGRYVRIDLEDDDLLVFEAGRLVVGAMFRPTINYTSGFERGAADSSRVDESVGGQEWVERRVTRRAITLRWPALTTAEVEAGAMPMQLERGISQDIGVMLDTASIKPGQDLIWGLPRFVPRIRHVAHGRLDMEVSVVERAWQ